MMLAINGITRQYGIFAARFVSNGTMGGAELEEGFGLILLGTLLGAFCGLIFGLLSSNLIKFLSLLSGKHVNGNAWTIGSVILGALLFALLAATGGEPETLPPTEPIVDD